MDTKQTAADDLLTLCEAAYDAGCEAFVGGAEFSENPCLGAEAAAWARGWLDERDADA